jgi:diguanylate cyclase (GGDEF)-like protein
MERERCMMEVMVAGLPAEISARLREELPAVTLHVETSGESTLARMNAKAWTAVIVGDELSDMRGMDVLRTLTTRARPHFPIIYQASAGRAESRAEALRLGVHRVLVGDPDANALAGVLRGMIEEDEVRPCVATDVSAAVGALWDRFKHIAFERLESIEEAIVAQLEGRSDAEQRRRAEREAHKLAGSVGTFGFAEASRVAREMELLLQVEPAAQDMLRLSDLSVALRRALELPSNGSAIARKAAASNGTTVPRRSDSPAAAVAGPAMRGAASRYRPASGNGDRAEGGPGEVPGSAIATALEEKAESSVETDAARPIQRRVGNGRSRDLRPLLLVLDAHEELTASIRAAADARGLRTRCAADPEEAYVALGAEQPAVVALDLRFGGTVDRGLALLAEVNRRAPTARRLILSTNGSPIEQMEIARRGGGVLLARPVTGERLAEAAADLLSATEGGTLRVLVVDDDPRTLEAVGADLRGPMMEVVTLADPLRFWETLERTRPDVLLLDETMPGIAGSELCPVLRADPRWAGLPVLLLSESADASTVRRAFEVGADDVIVKPFAGPELRTRVESRLERLRLQRTIAELDPLTGVANRRRSLATITALLQHAERSAGRFAVAVIDVDGLGEIDGTFGDAAGDAVLVRLAGVLRSGLKNDDVLGRWDGGSFVLALPGLDADAAARRVRAAQDRFRDSPAQVEGGRGVAATFSAGVAGHPADGRDVSLLLRTAETAMRQAKQEGPATILTMTPRPGSGPSGTEHVDIVLVEDDIALAGLLSHTMQTRGHTTRCIGNGDDAVASLCGNAPRLQGRVIVLDVDLPGRDGFEVLRALARDGVTERSRVVMLTVRATEPEVLQALELGAFDHIGKPFSVQILMQRLRRALAD